ncbi:hypothetical protein PV325_003730, partial [Microctonus aethiopoides]
GQPNIHPGSISSTGRGRIGGTATSTQAAQLIGGGITPNMFTSPATETALPHSHTDNDLRPNHFALSTPARNRRLVFSTPASKLRLSSSAVQILHTTNNFREFDYTNIKLACKRMINTDYVDMNMDLGWIHGRNILPWNVRFKKLRAILS